MTEPIMTDAVAGTLILFCSYAALAMAAGLAFLGVRRSQSEKHKKLNHEQAKKLSREILQVLAGRADDIEMTKLSDEALLQAVMKLFELLRGEDRAKLTEFAEQKGLVNKIRISTRSRSMPKKISAIQQLERIGSGRAISVLKDMLYNERQPMVQLEAASALSRSKALPPPEVLISILKLEQAALTPLHYALFRSLAPQHGDELAQLSQSKLPVGLRCALVEALGWTGDYSTLDAVAVAAEDKSPAVREAALMASSRIGHPAARRWIEKLLGDKNDHVRAHAAQLCAALNLRRLAADVAQLQNDPSALVRQEARYATQRLSGQKAA